MRTSFRDSGAVNNHAVARQIGTVLSNDPFVTGSASVRRRSSWLEFTSITDSLGRIPPQTYYIRAILRKKLCPVIRNNFARYAPYLASYIQSLRISGQSCFFVNLTILPVDVGTSRNDVRFARMSRQLML